MNRYRRHAAMLIPGLLAAGFCLVVPPSVLGQSEQQPTDQTPENAATPLPTGSANAADSIFPTKSQLPEAGKSGGKLDAISPERSAEAKKWIEALGASEFAARERAATDLMEVGTPILPLLRQTAEDTTDPEVRLRANQIIQQLTQGDMKVRIEDFLAGDDVGFEGWRVAQAILGDSNSVRELFVEMIQSHPGVTASLEGTPRDRAVAMDSVANRVKQAMFVERRFPNRADAFALLLPAVDPKVPINGTFESVLLSVLNKNAASEIRRDAQLSRPFRVLLNSWITRSTLSSREDVLLFGMSWDIEATLPLAVQTLGEANQTETLAYALQAIARFGGRDDVEVVRPFLDDTRPASERGYARGKMVRTQLGDVAMATIATLYEVPLTEVGFERAGMHPTYAFTLSEIGFPVEDDVPRMEAREKIEELLGQAPAAEGS